MKEEFFSFKTKFGEVFGSEPPDLVMVLGSGLSQVGQDWETLKTATFDSFPEIPSGNVKGHNYLLDLKTYQGKKILFVRGRIHAYEGFDLNKIVFLARALCFSGCQNFFLTNAAGSLTTQLKPGNLMLLKDHINCSGKNPFVGMKHTAFGDVFPDMGNLYDAETRNTLKNIASQNEIELNEGVYVCVLGPNYETPAEVKMFGLMGGDVVGMSTIHEAMAVKHMGAKVTACSVVTNYGAGLVEEEIDHSQVLIQGQKASHQIEKLVGAYLETL